MKLPCILCCIWLLSSTVLSTSLEDSKGQLANYLWEGLLPNDQKTHHESDDPMMMVKNYGIEMNPSDIDYLEDMLVGDESTQPKNETIDQESALKPTGKRRKIPLSPDQAAYILGIGAHTYCGPYTQHYSSDQCTLLGGIGHNRRLHGYHGLTVRDCEKNYCDKIPKCNAITWSHLKKYGCFLYNCDSNEKPMPRGENPDFVSFTKFKPDAIFRCINNQGPKSSGSHDTPMTFCGPYPNDFSIKQCKYIKNIPHEYDEDLHGPIECETFCMRNPSCTAFSHSPKRQHGCVLQDCGSNPPLPNGYNTDWISYTKKKPADASNC